MAVTKTVRLSKKASDRFGCADVNVNWLKVLIRRAGVVFVLKVVSTHAPYAPWTNRRETYTSTNHQRSPARLRVTKMNHSGPQPWRFSQTLWNASRVFMRGLRSSGLTGG